MGGEHEVAPPERGPRARLAGLAEASRRRADDARAWAEGAQAWAEDARGRSPLVARAFDVAERDRDRLGGLLAGALAYRLFLWLLPFALLFIGVLGAVTRFDASAVEDTSADVGLRGVLSQALADGSRQSGWWIALGVGLFGTAYAGMGAVRALHVSHSAAWGLPRERTPGVVRGSAILTGLALGLLTAGALAGWVRERSPLWGVVATLAMALLFFAVWLRVSVHLPHRPAPVRALVPGAVLVAVGVQGLNLFTTYYLAGRAERASSVYGTIGTALVLLLFLFILARLMVGAAVLNAALWEHRDRPRDRRRATSGPS